MAFTLFGYFQNVDTGGNLTYINPIPDPHLRIEGYNVIVPRDLNQLVGVLAFAPHISRARLESPSLRQRVLYDVPAADRDDQPYEFPNINRLFYNPIELVGDEGLRFLAAETVSGAEDIGCLVWLADGALEPVGGDIWTVRATTDNVGAANQWVNVSLTLDQTLPVGRYQLVGCRAHSTTIVAVRFVFVGYAWRPGTIGRTNISSHDVDIFRRGALGVWGEFDHIQPPTVDVWAKGAGPGPELYLDLIKIS
jgi:hypothetical protein